MSEKHTLKKTGILLAATGLVACVALVASGQSASTTNAQGKHWLGLMDTDNDATVDKQEFVKYVTTQFDKADTDHDGTLDAAELTQLRKSLLK